MAGAVLMGALLCARIARSRVEPVRAENVAAHASLTEASDPNAIKPHLEKLKKVAETLKKKNLFVKEPKKEHPVKEVDGILGDEVLIGDNWYKTGAKIGDAKIVSIEPTQVIIEWDGKEKAFAPLASGRGEAPSSPNRAPTNPKKVQEQETTKSEMVPEEVKTQVAEAPTEQDPLAWMGIDLPPKAREKIMAIWKGASEEERAKAKEEWNNMPEEEKRQAIDMMEQM